MAAGVLSLGCATAALGFEQLPGGAQVNDDPGAGINHEFAVGDSEPANSDVVGGSLSSSKPAVPWAIFQQNTSEFNPQIFVRSFSDGSWTTRGAGTVGGVASAEPKFSGSLNFDQTSGAEAPSIDFAGPERTVPWATWYEESTAFFGPEIFASRFDAAQNKWVFAGQGRGAGLGSAAVPSLNINPEQEAENPSIAGGSLTEPGKPGPWITWQENQLYTEIIKEAGEEFEEEFEHHQIYVVRPQSPNKEGGGENCDGFKPAGEMEGAPAHVPAIGGLCWQQVGIARFPTTEPEPTLNVDPTREGVEPDIGFTGKEDSVPWVVWYENGFSEVAGLSGHELVFAAKAVADEAAEGHLHWLVVGRGGEGTLNNKGTHKLGGCAETLAKEEACSLNSNPSADAEDPRMAAGTMTPGKATVPWIAWDETVGAVRQVFVARLNPESGRFELANGGAPISTGGVNSTRPDITFSGNTPYVSWRERVSPGVFHGFFGHFVNAAAPKFVFDESEVPLAPIGFEGSSSVREPISSSCIATPANVDGSACQGGALGTPFFLFTNGNPLALFAGAYQPETPVTGGASEVTSSSASVSGAVNPVGASVSVFFEYGTTAAYGQVTQAEDTPPNNAATPFAATLSGLPAGSTIHYRAVARSDFGTFAGADQTVMTTITEAEREAKERAEREAKEKAEREAKERAEREAKEKAEREAKERAEREAKEKAEREAKERAEREAKEKAEREAKERAAGISTSPTGTAVVSRASVEGVRAIVAISCRGPAPAKCTLLMRMSLTEILSGRNLVGVTARASTERKVVVVGSGSATVNAGQTRTVTISLNGTGRKLLARRHRLEVRLGVTQTFASATGAAAIAPRTIASRVLAFKAHKHH